jgi:hypothetical protein
MLLTCLDMMTPAHVPAVLIGGTYPRPNVKGDLPRELFLALYRGSEEGPISDM